MILKLVREMTGNEFVHKMEEKYGQMSNLERLMASDPENVLYPLDMEDWVYHLEHPEATVNESETIFLKDLKIDMRDLKLLDTIKNEHPRSIRNLAHILDRDIKSIQPRVKRLADEGLLKLEHGPKNAKKPVVNFNKIEIEI